MIHLKKLTLTLVALFAMTTGAWADDQSESFTTATNGQLTYTGEHFTISGQKADTDGLWIGNAGGSDYTVTISSRNGENITKIEAVLSYGQNWGDTKLATTSGEVTGTYDVGQTITISSVNATTVTLSGPEGEFKLIEFNSWTIYYGDAPTPAGTALTPDDTRKVWTLDKMPAGNVELQVAYFPGMLTLAQADGGTIAVDGLSLGGVKALNVPEAWKDDETVFSAADMPGFDDRSSLTDEEAMAIPVPDNEGTVVLIYGFDGTKIKLVFYTNGECTTAGSEGDTRKSIYLVVNNNGLKFYYTTAETLPENFDTDGTNIYVEPKTEFKVKAVPAEGFRLVKLTAGETDITTKVDADGIATVTMPDDDADLTLTATFSNEYELTFAAANANTIESGKASVTVDGTAATPTEGKLSVKAGQKVKITTTSSDYIIRKAEVKKDGVAGPEVTETKDDADNVIAAEFDMPSYDATLEYDIVRNLASNMTVTVGDGTEGYRIRVKKDGNGYVPAELTIQEILALIKVHDDTEQKDLTIVTDFTAAIYAVDDNGQKTGDAITFANLTPGSYVVTATAPDDSPLYAGQTPQSNIFELYQGYEVTVPAGEYITYYKEEALYVENENAKLYTITDVSETTATATELTVAPALTPILVQNTAQTPQTILLIPTTSTDQVNYYDGFKGTLEATTIAASTASTNNYAFNGKQFVWVKTALAVAANKAWLEIPAGGVSTARVINLVFDEATGVNEVIEVNGVNDNSFYDLNGRKINMPTKKGVYIMNGRKVVVK
ncbi:MAG: hypothetical protein IK058_03475 [Bacteroidales bacterium]|nr:hypothetical protein [Bacteroidales bacterium]